VHEPLPVYQNVGGHSYGWVYRVRSARSSRRCTSASTRRRTAGGFHHVQPVRGRLPGPDSAADLQRKLREKAFEQNLRPWYERLAIRTWAWVAQRPALYALGRRSACGS